MSMCTIQTTYITSCNFLLGIFLVTSLELYLELLQLFARLFIVIIIDSIHNITLATALTYIHHPSKIHLLQLMQSLMLMELYLTNKLLSFQIQVLLYLLFTTSCYPVTLVFLVLPQQQLALQVLLWTQQVELHWQCPWVCSRSHMNLQLFVT